MTHYKTVVIKYHKDRRGRTRNDYTRLTPDGTVAETWKVHNDRSKKRGR